MAFRGQRVMLSRSLVPPEMFDMLHGTLKENGAEVCLCSNPSYNSSDDFHVLPSSGSAKFAELQSQGCNVVGPECILRCAKERRPFPSARYTCCMSLDGIRILSTGFEGSEKVGIMDLVTAMCGELFTKASMDVDFVVAKDVLTPKYKWSAFTLRKPILSVDWLLHCFREHRRVPHEPYRLPIFTGIIMCTTGIQLEERKKIADLVLANGGALRADLTRECTHLIAKSTDSDKFKVARMHWGHIKCVTEEWFWNSISEKVCLEENHYTVQNASKSYGPQISSAMFGPPPVLDKCSQDPGTGDVLPSWVPEVDRKGPLGILAASGEECHLYLSGCRFYLTGFESAEMRRLVNMVLGGGGTRYMEFNERVTHVVIGKPAESELKNIRQYAMWGAVHIVTPTWLEECSSWKRQVPVSARFVVPQVQLSQDVHLKLGRSTSAPVNAKKSLGESMPGRMLQKKLLVVSQAQPDANTVSQDVDVPRQPLGLLASNPANFPRHGAALDLRKKISLDILSPIEQVVLKEQSRSTLSKDNDGQQPQVMVSNPPNDTRPELTKQLPDSLHPVEETQEPIKPSIKTNAGPQEMTYAQNATPTSSQLIFDGKKRVFEGCVFGFAPSFEACIRAEVIQWVLEGGGRMLGDVSKGELQEEEFLICPHGPQKDPCTKLNVKSITTQWIKYCLQEDTLLGADSHLLFQPLRCEVPLPGFQSFRFAISQYADRERILLYNLCHILGAKYQEKKMNRRATHLLCKVGDGDKYEAALLWGIEIVTADWLFACVAQNMVVLPDPYRPKRLTVADKEAGLAIATQYPAQSTPCDTGAPCIERSSTQHDVGVSSLAAVNHLEGVEVKGKTENIKQKPNLLGRLRSTTLKAQTLQGNRASKICSLSSQMTGGNLDPWDTASWAREGATRQSSTTSQQKAVSYLKEDDNNNASQASEIHEPVRVAEEQKEQKNLVDPVHFEKEEDESGADVASAIEGLLAQTRKVQTEDASRSSDVDRDLLLPDSIQLNRRNSGDLHEHSNFKRPKIVSHRSMDSGGEQQLVQTITPAEDMFEKFEESQMDSQVVAYDEDYSEKQRIMERVRTRSMSSSGVSGSGANVQRREKMSWKGIDFNRLLKAADANK